jgi:hypothetical protein
MKRPCQAFAGRWVVDHLMPVFRWRFYARSTCPPDCRFRRDGRVRPPLAGPGPAGGRAGPVRVSWLIGLADGVFGARLFPSRRVCAWLDSEQ